MTSWQKVLSFGNTVCADQISARPKSSFLFYEKLSTYASPMVSADYPFGLAVLLYFGFLKDIRDIRFDNAVEFFLSDIHSFYNSRINPRFKAIPIWYKSLCFPNWVALNSSTIASHFGLILKRIFVFMKLHFYDILEIKTFGLVSRIRDMEVGGLKNHDFLPWGCSSNLIWSTEGFLRVLRNFHLILFSINQLLCDN